MEILEVIWEIIFNLVIKLFLSKDYFSREYINKIYIKSIAENYYIFLVRQNKYRAVFYSLKIEESITRVFADELIVQSKQAPNLSTLSVYSMSKKETFSCPDYGYKYTFYPQANKVIFIELLEHYPSDYKMN